jgi:hypothetical protein
VPKDLPDFRPQQTRPFPLGDDSGNPGVFGIDEWGGKKYRTFFLREQENGYCFFRLGVRLIEVAREEGQGVFEDLALPVTWDALYKQVRRVRISI